MKGIFISFEGGEGCGKGTAIKNTKKYLEGLGKVEGEDFIMFREPGAIPGTNSVTTEINETIRDWLTLQKYPLTVEAEVLLFAVGRSLNTEKYVRPALEKGMIVIADRFIDSSLVYQGYARGVGEERVRDINEFATRNMYPDCTIFMDVDPEIAIPRKGGPDEGETFEQQKMEFHKTVRSAYNGLAKKESDRYVVINATNKIDEVWQDLKKVLDEKLGLNKEVEK